MANLFVGQDNPNYNPNLTTSTGLSPSMQTYYNMGLLMNMKTQLKHAEHAKKFILPKHHGKTANWRRWNTLPAITTALAEGIVPNGQKLSQTDLSVSTNSYGGYVTVSDVVSWVATDPVVQDAVEQLAEQGGLSLDRLVRKELHGSATNVLFAGGKTAISGLSASEKLTTAELRKAVTILKKNKAPTFKRGGKEHYIAIVGPDTVYDLQDDTKWLAVSQYQDKENIYSGEIGRLFGVVFVETSESKIYGGPALGSDLAVASYVTATKTITLNRDMTDDEIETIMDTKAIKYGATAGAVASAIGKTVVLSGTIATDPVAADAFTVVGPGASGALVGATLVFGADAYGICGLEGNDNVSVIVKGKELAGGPLEQASTIGWKVGGFATKILYPERIIQILHGVTDISA